MNFMQDKQHSMLLDLPPNTSKPLSLLLTTGLLKRPVIVNAQEHSSESPGSQI